MLVIGPNGTYCNQGEVSMLIQQARFDAFMLLFLLLVFISVIVMISCTPCTLPSHFRKGKRRPPPPPLLPTTASYYATSHDRISQLKSQSKLLSQPQLQLQLQPTKKHEAMVNDRSGTAGTELPSISRKSKEAGMATESFISMNAGFKTSTPITISTSTPALRSTPKSSNTNNNTHTNTNTNNDTNTNNNTNANANANPTITLTQNNREHLLKMSAIEVDTSRPPYLVATPYELLSSDSTTPILFDRSQLPFSSFTYTSPRTLNQE